MELFDTGSISNYEREARMDRSCKAIFFMGGVAQSTCGQSKRR